MFRKRGKFSKSKKDAAPVKSRKEIRKEIRNEKKLRRSHQYRISIRDSEDQKSSVSEETSQQAPSVKAIKVEGKGNDQSAHSKIEAQNLIEQKEKKKLMLEMKKSRKKTLLAANEEEDRNIRKLEKLLKLNKHKRKSLPKSFVEDGLSYLLDVCNPNTLKDSAKAEQTLIDSGSDFEEDLALVKGSKVVHNSSRLKSGSRLKNDVQEESDLDVGAESDFDSDADHSGDTDEDDNGNEGGLTDEDDNDEEDDEVEGVGDSDDDGDSFGSEGSKSNEDQMLGEDDLCESDLDKPPTHSKKVNEKMPQLKSNHKRKKEESLGDANPIKKSKNFPEKKAYVKESAHIESETQNDSSGSDCFSESDGDKGEIIGSNSSRTIESEANSNGIWEDIYGRTRDKDGNVVENKPSKYIPPALRAKMLEDEDSNRKERLMRIKRQMKGLINRLAENNMPSISTQIDEMYMSHSRYDMNSTLLQLCLEALVSTVLTPERLVMEHILLISVLHANVGSEVGAHFLQNIMKKFQETLDLNPPVENKELDNLILILSHLYNFKILHASLLFEVLNKVADVLNEKRIELLLLVLRSVGFSLRKDDPIALKDLILTLQNKAVNLPDNSSISSRMKYMLDILLAIKNNNVSKIPSYDPEYTEHLKKLQRSLLRRGNYVTELKISLEDILKVEERGRWWIVGSAWTGYLPGENPNSSSAQSNSVKAGSSTPSSVYSAQLLELARKQRMNTGVRKDIFCILMTSEDYMDAFEKLLHLGLKNQQRQEIVHVLFDCCLQEKTFNPFYAHLAQRFCDFDRQYQMKFQYCLWDKLKEADKLSNSQTTNLARFLAHLFLEKGLPLSVLKVISFAEMDKACVRLVRQVLLAVLLAKDPSASEAVFRRIAVSPQLHLFREGIRLFINHFVLRKSNKKTIAEDEAALLHIRAKVADKALASSDSKVEF